jgi:hypothetical protein
MIFARFQERLAQNGALRMVTALMEYAIATQDIQELIVVRPSVQSVALIIIKQLILVSRPVQVAHFKMLILELVKLV